MLVTRALAGDASGELSVPCAGMAGRAITGRVPKSLKRRIPAIRERDALRREVGDLRARARELEQRLDHERLFPAQWANRRVRDEFGDVVRAGPFAGLRYPDWALGSIDLFAPKLLGIFELELHEAVERLIAAGPRLVVNVGAADGYYAVGLARRMPHARVIAFEPNGERLDQLRAIAELNGVGSRIEIVASACDHAALEAVADRRIAIVCDCDGCEAELLDPARVPGLRDARLVVEAHDLLLDGITPALESAFGSSHEIVTIRAQPRFVDDFPELDFMPLVTRQLAISEFRGAPMWWLELIPRAAAPEGS